MSRETITYPQQISRSLPIGAEIQPEGGVHFRVWAPECRWVEVLFGDESEWRGVGGENRQAVPLDAEKGGYYSGWIENAVEGMLYQLRVESGSYPDPASRYQPQGPHGPSQIIDPNQFHWHDQGWKGIPNQGQVIYEMHVGTFTPLGTFKAASEQLQELVNIGITVLEIMPVAEFPGRFGWGYDGVGMFAPMHCYGSPDDLRALIDHAHAIGLGVILDVVYNHFGPDGNYLGKFSSHYTSDRYKNEWGEAINFDGPESRPVREFFVSNALYWIKEFHFDGFRFDATQQIFDVSEEHILAEISRKVRDAVRAKSLLLVAENEEQSAQLALPFEIGGCGLDALWNDDFHHSARVALTGLREAYYQDFHGTAQEFVAAAKFGFLYQGQWYSWQKKNRGSSALELRRWQFISYLENHDQVANSLRGDRLHRLANPAALRALTALLLLGPGTPLIFQGQEFAASAPFQYFADHQPELAQLVRKGRKEFLCQFPSIAEARAELELNSPESEQTFLRCKLDLSERSRNASHYRMYKDLLALRRTDPVFSGRDLGKVDGASLNEHAFIVRYFSKEQNSDRLLILNLGVDLSLNSVAEPLIAPHSGHEWKLIWSSENHIYGGSGTRLEVLGPLSIPGFAAVALRPAPKKANKFND